MTDKKAKTMDLKGNQYAKVADRLKEFREANPRGKSETDHKYLDDGIVEFKAWLWKDKTELIELMKAGVTDKESLRSSADADGDAKGVITDQKAFEKLQSVAMGRALANLGYLSSGEIASSEEMEVFMEYQKEQREQAINETLENMFGAQTLDELKKIFIQSRLMSEQKVVEAKDKRKAELLEREAVNDNN